jgi:F-type H+-transporting ATPase subunit gamma
MLSHLAMASSTEINHPYFEIRPVRKRTLVVVTSDKGLCGAFNANVIRKANNWLKESDAAGIASELLLVGKKGNDFFKRRDWQILNVEADWKGALDYNRARDIVRFLTDRFISGETDEISLIYTTFVSLAKYVVTTQDYLPVPRPEIGEAAGEHLNVNREYIFEPDAEEIYAALMPSYATTKMVTALAESFASEHGSRMVAMNAATKNALEMIDRLTLDYNKARQAQITKELLEIVSGANALAG